MKKTYLILLFLSLLSLKINAQSCDVYFGSTIQSDTVFFDAYHSDGLATGSYSWSFGDGNTSSLKNPIHIYSTSGTFNVSLNFTSTSDTSCTPSFSDSVVINTCSLTATISSGNTSCFSCADGSASAFATGGTPSYIYSWSNGATTQSINNLQTGTYTVTITDISGCNFSSSIIIYSPQQCDVFFTSNVSSNSVSFSAFHSENLTGVYSWDFGDGGTATVKNPTHSYSASGTYFVTVNFASSTDNTCTPSLTDSVLINLCPLTATITSTNVSCNGCSDGTATITASGGTAPYSYIWVSGVTSSYIDNLAVGTYSAIVTDAIGCSYTVSTYISGPAQCDVYFSSIVSDSTTVFFNAYHSDSIVSGIYSWDFGDGETGSGQNPVHTYNNSGSYTVYVSFSSSTDSSCNPSFYDVVLVNLAPVYDLIGLVYAGVNILDEAYVSVYKQSNALFYSYTDVLINGGEFNISGLPQGTYLVKVSPTPSSSFFGQYLPTYYGDSTLWAGAELINLNATFYGTFNLVPFVVTDTTWNSGNDIFLGTVFQDTTGFGRAGSNPVRNTTVNMRNSSNDLLTAQLTDENGVFKIKNVAAGNYKLEVDYPGYVMQPFLITADGDSTTSTSINFDLEQNGSIAVSILNTYHKIKTGLISIYPNPASDILFISTASFNLNAVQIKITSFSGNVIYTNQMVLNKDEVKLDISEIPNGIYFISVQTDKEIITKKLIIKH
ncbi:MAG: PKD domain-containing protein [Bacteroidetes bacterium]|nr:PKD domain-containing protein [Bacteroidota bacterium]HET6245435.1 PKD domain-containing protein [Bacteroidia bacterium]